MGLVDMFTAEDRVPMKVSNLYAILQDAADIEAENKIMKRMLNMDVFIKQDIQKLFAVDEHSEEE